MYDLTNIPSKKSGLSVGVAVNGPHIRIEAKSSSGDALGMTTLYLGDHMFSEGKKQDLREMVGRWICAAIEHSRDVGYRQAQRDIRAALDIK